VTIGANILSLQGASNGPQWKGLLPFVQKEGVLFKDASYEITAQVQSIKYLVRTLLTFKGMSTLEVQLSNQSEIAAAIDVQVSPVKYQAG
jgi:hypothetical protein